MGNIAQKFLPYENITYRTKLKEEEVINRLNNFVEPEKIFRFNFFGNGSSKSYEGDILGNKFYINRIINYRNSFLPRITGTVRTEVYETTIKVKMRLSIFVVIFLCFWCIATCSFCFLGLFFSYKSNTFYNGSLVPLGMLLFAYCLTMGGFKFESYKSRKHLLNLFEAEII